MNRSVRHRFVLLAAGWLAAGCSSSDSGIDETEDQNVEQTTEALTNVDYGEETAQVLERFVFSVDSPIVNDDLQGNLTDLPSCDDYDEPDQCPAVDVTCELIGQTIEVEFDFEAESCDEGFGGQIVFSRTAAFDWELTFDELEYVSESDELDASVRVDGSLRVMRESLGIWQVTAQGADGLSVVVVVSGTSDIEDCPGDSYPCIDSVDYVLTSTTSLTTSTPITVEVELEENTNPEAGITITIDGSATIEGTMTGQTTQHWIRAAGPLRDSMRTVSDTVEQTVTFAGVVYDSEASCTCPTAGTIRVSPGLELLEGPGLNLDCGQVTITFSGCDAAVSLANTNMLCTEAAANLTNAFADICYDPEE